MPVSPSRLTASPQGIASAGSAAAEPVQPALLTGALAALLLLALAGPLLSLPVFQFGLWSKAEPMILWQFVIAAGAALLLLAAQLRDGRSIPATAWWLSLPLLLLSLWALVLGAFSGQPLEGLLGAAQAGNGAAWFLVLAVWCLAGGLLMQSLPVRRWLLPGAVVVATALLVIRGHNLITGDSWLLAVPAYYGWPALCLPLLILLRPAPPGRIYTAAALILLAAALLLASRAATLVIAGAMALALVLLARHRRLGAALASPAILSLLLLAAVIVPLGVLEAGALTSRFPSLEARRLLGQIIRADLLETPWNLLLGHGFGQTQAAIARHLQAADYPLYDQLGWDLLHRDYFHSHNWLLEMLLSGGVIAAGLMAWLFLGALRLAAPDRRLLAGAFAAAWLLSLGFWFELIFALPWLALGFTAALPATAAEAPPAAMPLRAAALGLAVLVLAAASGLQLQQSLNTNQVAQWNDAPATAAPPLQVPDTALAFLLRLQAAAINRPGGDAALLETKTRWLAQQVNARRDLTRNPDLLLRAVELADQAMLIGRDPAQQALLRPHWAGWLDRALTLAPQRSAAAIAYLNDRLQQGDLATAIRLARRLQQTNPNDPVGMFFEGAALVLPGPASNQPRGLALLRASFAAGIEKSMPVDPGLKEKLLQAPRGP